MFLASSIPISTFIPPVAWSTPVSRSVGRSEAWTAIIHTAHFIGLQPSLFLSLSLLLTNQPPSLSPCSLCWNANTTHKATDTFWSTRTHTQTITVHNTKSSSNSSRLRFVARLTTDSSGCINSECELMLLLLSIFFLISNVLFSFSLKKKKKWERWSCTNVREFYMLTAGEGFLLSDALMVVVVVILFLFSFLNLTQCLPWWEINTKRALYSGLWRIQENWL